MSFRLITPRFAMLALLLTGLAASPTEAAVSFDLAEIGNAGNAPDPETGYGAVAYDYAISKTEVTNAQYVEFLNATASTDLFSGPDFTLYSPSMSLSTQGGIVRSGTQGNYSYSVKAPALGQGVDGTDYTYGDKPVVFVSFFDAMRFTNWLHNGQGSGDTESGVYTISDGLIETRAADATYWIPSEDEWYKAAYHDASAGTAGVYFDFSTGTDAAPDNNLPAADTGNSVNFFASGDLGYTTGDSDYPLTDVGAYGLSASPYGTYDQGGNVWEWNEAVIGFSQRGLRGGSWTEFWFLQRADFPDPRSPTGGDHDVGFRVATLSAAGVVPEPSMLLVFGGLMGTSACVLRR